MTTYNIKDVSLYWNGGKVNSSSIGEEEVFEESYTITNISSEARITFTEEDLAGIEAVLEERAYNDGCNDSYLLTDLEDFLEDFDWEGDL